MTRLKQMESRNKEIVSAAGRDPLRDSLDRIRLEIVSTFTVDAALTLRRATRSIAALFAAALAAEPFGDGDGAAVRIACHTRQSPENALPWSALLLTPLKRYAFST